MIDKIKTWADSPEGKDILKTTAYVGGGGILGLIANKLVGKKGLGYDIAATVAGGLGGYGLKRLGDKDVTEKLKEDRDERNTKELKKAIAPNSEKEPNANTLDSKTSKKPIYDNEGNLLKKSERDLAHESGYYINRDKDGGISNYSKDSKPSIIQKIMAFINAKRTLTDEQVEKAEKILNKKSSDPNSEWERMQAEVNYNKAQKDAADSLIPFFGYTGIGSGFGLTAGSITDYLRHKYKTGSEPFPKEFKTLRNGDVVKNTTDLQNVMRNIFQDATSNDITEVQKRIKINNTPKFGKMSKPMQNVVDQLETVRTSKPASLTSGKLLQVDPSKGIDPSTRKMLVKNLSKGAYTISTEPGVFLPNSKVNMFKQKFYKAPSRFKALRWLWPTFTGLGAAAGAIKSGENFNDATQRIIDADRQRKELNNFLGK